MIEIRVLRETTAVVIVAMSTACGGTAPPRGDLEWTANARGVVEQLREEVVAVSGYDRLAAASTGLRDESQLYALLVAYTDFGGCRHMVTEVGVEPRRLADVVRSLRGACLHLQRADRLFTRAVAQRAPRFLVDATHEALAAVPSLNAAALELAADRRAASER
jgi:hypothetical protein